MVVLRDPGEVFLAGHTFGGDSRAWVERLDEDTLAPVARSPDLAAGPWWPGGIAAHRNGSLYVTCGRWCHRLAPDCSPLAARELPRERPYNSLLVLPDGNLVMKDLVLDRSEPSRLVVLEPERLTPLGPEVAVPEPSIARISADGDVVYVLGDRTAFRYEWQPGSGRLVRDESWRVPYRQLADQSYAWDAVVAGGQLWFMDNGEHRYAGTMRGAGVAEGPLHLVRAALDSGAFELVPVCGLPAGAITNPPCFDPERGIAIAFDSANAILAAFRFTDGLLRPLWSKPLGVASHMVRYPDTGELVVNDHGDDGDAIVVLDIETGAERARALTGSPVQSVVFPAAGFGRDLWYCSFARIARLVAA
jgi:hypothetical protein